MKIKTIILSTIFLIILNSCANLPGGDAKKNPPQPELRVKKNLEEGKGFRLNDVMGGKNGGTFEFATSNELWRATLDTIDFIPLQSANYSGGIIITDWYSNEDESVKITLRFLSNEVRSDSLKIKVFYKKCDKSMKCNVFERDGTLQKELKKEILRRAAIYQKQTKDKNFKPYEVTDLKD